MAKNKLSRDHFSSYVFTYDEAKAWDLEVQKQKSAHSLMEEVAQNIAAKLESDATFTNSKTKIFLIGPGNNGGDGLSIIKHLKNKKDCFAFCWSGPQLSALRIRQEGELKKAGFKNLISFTYKNLEPILAKTNDAIFIDAFFGIAFKKRAFPTEIKKSLEFLNAYLKKTNAAMYAVDVISGLNTDGTLDSVFKNFSASKSFCVNGPKWPQIEAQGPDVSGDLDSVFFSPAYASKKTYRFLSGDLDERIKLFSDLKVQLNTPKRSAHKKSRPKIAVIGGTLMNGGATRLVAESALRMGAGYVVIYENKLRQQKFKIDDSREWILKKTPHTLKEWAHELDSFDSIVFGPGFAAQGLTTSELQIYKSFYKSLGKLKSKHLVIDAGGMRNFLGCIKKNPKILAKHKICFTPHPGEAHTALKILGNKNKIKSRRDLFECLRNELKTFKINGSLLLKGAYPIMGFTKDSKHSAVFNLADPRLATMGSGDVFAGALASLMAQMGGESSNQSYAALYETLRLQKKATGSLVMGSLAGDIAIAMQNANCFN